LHRVQRTTSHWWRSYRPVHYLFARQHGGDMLLRIEDTDSARFVPGAEDYIVEALQWLGITIDEGIGAGKPGNHAPYRQSERKAIYRKYVDQLLEAGLAYIAFDTPTELEVKRAEIANFQYDASTRQLMTNSLTLSADEVKRQNKQWRTICGAYQNRAQS